MLDIATTIVSYGTVKNHKLQGKPMQDGLDGRLRRPARRSPIRSKAPKALLLPMAATRARGSR